MTDKQIANDNKIALILAVVSLLSAIISILIVPLALLAVLCGHVSLHFAKKNKVISTTRIAKIGLVIAYSWIAFFIIVMTFYSYH